MKRPSHSFRLLALTAAIACLAMPSLAQKKIVVRIFDGRNGEKISPDNLEVRINRQQASHIEWVKINDDGTVELTLPDTATALALRATYDNSMDYYVNCDVARQKNTSTESWFPIDDVLKTGIVMSDECRKSKDMQMASPKPGEFILYVRKRGPRDAIPYSLPY
jgi:hypothetical protein